MIRRGAGAKTAVRKMVRWRLSTRIVVTQIGVLLVVAALGLWLNLRLAEDRLNEQYEYRSLAVAQTVADMPQTIDALSGTGPASVVQSIALQVGRSTGAAFVVVVNRGGIRLSSPDPSLVGKSFHERVVSLDGRDHLRIDPGKPSPSANARAPVFGPGGRVVGEVSVGFLERQVAAAAWREVPAIAGAGGVALLVGAIASVLLARRLKRITHGLELEEITGLLGEVRQMADEQESLRRVATLVATGVPKDEIFSAVAGEVGRLADADTVQMYRYESGKSIERIAVWGSGADELKIGARYQIGGHNVATMVLRTGQSARLDDSGTITGEPARVAATLGFRSVIGTPIAVDGRVWGLVTITTSQREPMPEDTEQRVTGFTELVATAITNAQARADLTASRRRVVAAADEMRRRIERNLHDGTQQRIVTLALELRDIKESCPKQPELRSRLLHVTQELGRLHDELREISRGLHPAILSQAGLGPAMNSLARRAALPVELNVSVPRRLPEPVEVAAYYVVSEALANAAKHSGATTIRVDVEIDDGQLRIGILDDGEGGASEANGSGIVGLRDRVEALGGTMVLASPPGEGTTLRVELPFEHAPV
jgi:signal transduction histidine kinase